MCVGVCGRICSRGPAVLWGYAVSSGFLLKSPMPTVSGIVLPIPTRHAPHHNTPRIPQRNTPCRSVARSSSIFSFRIFIYLRMGGGFDGLWDRFL